MTWRWLWLVGACGSPPPTTWATPPPTWQVPLCRPPEPLPPLQQTVRVRLLLGDDVPEEALATQTRALVDWWAAQGLTITLDLPVRRIDVHAMLEGAADLSDGLPDAARAQELARVLAPVRAFIQTHARPVREHTIVVAMLPHIAAPGSWADASFEALRGLTLSPSLLGEPGPSPVQDALRQDGPYTPVVLLSQTDLAAARGETARLTLAHEVGHALGLPHHPDPWNLMAASPAPCIPLLDAAQAHQLRQALQPVVPPTTQDAELR